MLAAVLVITAVGIIAAAKSAGNADRVHAFFGVGVALLVSLAGDQGFRSRLRGRGRLRLASATNQGDGRGTGCGENDFHTGEHFEII